MQIVYENFLWMGLNVALAILGVSLGWLYYFIRKPLISLIFLILWVLFIPNTIYLITDLQHFLKQWDGALTSIKPVLIIQYALLFSFGLITYLLSMYPIDKIFEELHLKKKDHIRFLIILFFNLLIAFALVLGKFQRTNSWYIFTDPQQVYKDSISVLINPSLLILVFIFGIFINLIYFGLKNYIFIKKNKKRKNY